MDEVGDLPLNAQAKLLRVLQERRLTRLGEERYSDIDVRVVSATNRPLTQLVQDGGFRADLYFRLNVIPIALPPLRERLEDLPGLISKLLERFGFLNKKFTREVMELFFAHPWRGNIRELENVLHFACLNAKTPWVTPADLPPYFLKATTKRSPSLDDQHRGKSQNTHDCASFSGRVAQKVAEAELQLIQDALVATRNNRSEAIRLLGISRKAFYEKLHRYRLLGKGQPSP